MKIIVIGDSHAKPLWYYEKNEDGKLNKKLMPMQYANRRYTWLAQLIIKEIKADPKEEVVVVDIGDFADMKSLSSYDKGKKPAENERLQLDIDYARDARERLTRPILEYVSNQNGKHKVRPRVRLVACLGNHEHRWERLKKDEPHLDIVEGIDDLSGASKLGWEVYPFLEPVNINGVYFCHYFTSGPKGFAIGGVNPARALVLAMLQSCVAGHSHEVHVHRHATALGTKIGVVCGCFFEHYEDYAGIQGNPRWWRGIMVLDNVENGEFHERKIPLEHIKRKFWTPSQGDYDLSKIGHPMDNPDYLNKVEGEIPE